jgi:hypothetical protein
MLEPKADFSIQNIRTENQLLKALFLEQDQIYLLGANFDAWTANVADARGFIERHASNPETDGLTKSRVMFMLAAIGDTRSIDVLYAVATSGKEDYRTQVNAVGWIACAQIAKDYALEKLDYLIRSHGTPGVEVAAVHALFNWLDTPRKNEVITQLKADKQNLYQEVREFLDELLPACNPEWN